MTAKRHKKHRSKDTPQRGLAGFLFSLRHAFHDVSHEAVLLEEGLAHLDEADQDMREELERNLLTCAVETGLSFAETLDPVPSVIVASAESMADVVGKKKINGPSVLADVFISLTSSPANAMCSLVKAVRNVEDIGEQYERRHHRLCRV